MPSRNCPARRSLSARSLFSLLASQSQRGRRPHTPRAVRRVLPELRALAADSLDVAVAADVDVVDALPVLVST